MRKWRNWQTRRLQVPVVAIPCGFKSYYYKVKAVSIGDNGVVSTSASSPVAYVKSTK